MKKYLTPEIDIKSFERENIMTGSANLVDEWNQSNGYDAKTIDWNSSDLKVVF